MKLPLPLLILLCMLPGVAWADCQMPAPEGKPICTESGWSDHIFSQAPKPYNIREDKSDWHLLTVSHSGTVSLIRELSKGECEEVKYKLHVLYYCPNNGECHKDDSDIDRAACFQ